MSISQLHIRILWHRSKSWAQFCWHCDALNWSSDQLPRVGLETNFTTEIAAPPLPRKHRIGKISFYDGIPISEKAAVIIRSSKEVWVHWTLHMYGGCTQQLDLPRKLQYNAHTLVIYYCVISRLSSWAHFLFLSLFDSPSLRFAMSWSLTSKTWSSLKSLSLAISGIDRQRSTTQLSWLLAVVIYELQHTKDHNGCSPCCRTFCSTAQLQCFPRLWATWINCSNDVQ